MVSLKTDIGSISLERPGIVASGIMDETGPSMVRMLECGAGAVVTKSVGLEPHAGHANPCFTEVTGGYVNAMGLPNPGIELFKEEMEVAVPKGPIVGSIYGAGPDDFSKLAGKMEDYGACAVELNLSCPHAKGYGMEVGTDPAMVKSIVSAVKSSVSIPVWAKLTPNTHILGDIGMAVQDAGGDAVVAINTLKAMVICPEMGRPLLSNRFGGLSGAAVKPVGVRAVYEDRPGHPDRRGRGHRDLARRSGVHHGRRLGIPGRERHRHRGSRRVLQDQRRPLRLHGGVRLRIHRRHDGGGA